MKGDFLARSCSYSLRVHLGCSVSGLSISGDGLLRMLLFGIISRCCCTAWVCIVFLLWVLYADWSVL